jgi:hypothetical protein
MTTKNTIVTSIIDSVLFLPIESIFNNDSITFVYKKDGGSYRKQQVIVGLSNENEIIIKAGLNEEDEVLLSPPEEADKAKLIPLSPEIIKKFEVREPEKKADSAKPKKDSAIIIKN